ncbi:hypothetical protein PDESU_03745 [Pontiella desulfatans]|uniref:Uncharacterized protein n=1 Tax=Pontiella desulfatans TaxID=2750659 RepID=A0A6C2U5K7_PONDE|nr:hypothetical protein [Pontiella desulfatans]VGO15163.1 hypothetical protein PDESU_03745 [Pontiella desulfatans]
MKKRLFYCYLTACIGIGGWLGHLEWDGIVGALGGGFIGLLIGLALFACFAIILALLPHKNNAPRT